jgi:hypothetical protein
MLPVGNGGFFRLSEKEWEDWQRVNKLSPSSLKRKTVFLEMSSKKTMEDTFNFKIFKENLL